MTEGEQSRYRWIIEDVEDAGWTCPRWAARNKIIAAAGWTFWLLAWVGIGIALNMVMG